MAVLDHRAAVWDLVAGAAVLLEASGVVSDPVGSPLFPVIFNDVRVPALAGKSVTHAEAVAACRGGLLERDR